MRHNEIRDLLAQLLGETCHNVAVEPALHPLSGEQFSSRSANTTEGARVDIKAGGFWGSNRFEDAFFDVRVFNPHAASYRSLSQANVYRLHERQKRREYEERIREVDRGSFSPLVLSCAGGIGPCATVFLKRLAAQLASKRDLPYSSTMAWLRCRITFALLRSSILCLRGSRRHRNCETVSQPELALAEGRFNTNA